MKFILLFILSLSFLNPISSPQFLLTKEKNIQDSIQKLNYTDNNDSFLSAITSLFSYKKLLASSNPITDKKNKSKEGWERLVEKVYKKIQPELFEPKKKQTKKEDKKSPKTEDKKKEKTINKSEAFSSNKKPRKKITNSTKQPQKKVTDKKDKVPSKKISSPQPVSHKNPCTIELKIEGSIGAATLDALERAIYQVEKQSCSALLLLINTPGGQLLSTRKIVDRILNTSFPVLSLIYPAGAHAGSAGAIIMQACHVNGAIETTNIGAATPIMGGGQKIADDLRKKMINDTTSWLDSLTQLRKRSKKFGREIVTEAKALSAQDAFKEKGIDFVGKTKQEFLQFAEGREVTVKNGELHVVQIGDLVPFHLGFRHRLISLITGPEFVYLLFSGSLLLLYFEITHPGLGAPGILGVMGLILSFMGMHKLDFSWAGVILILLSMVLFLAEVFISGFGIFGASGVVSFFLGSVLLFDPSKTGGVDIPISLILSITFTFAILMGLITWLALSTFKIKRKKSISDDFMDKMASPATIVQVNEDGVSGFALIKGENWRFRSKTKVHKGDRVKVISYKELTLEVEPENS